MDLNEIANLRQTVESANDKTVLIVKKQTLLDLYAYIDQLADKIVRMQRSIPEVYQKGVTRGKEVAREENNATTI